MKVEYSTNNSGGNWWLKDEDWFALEKAGWKVQWRKDDKDNVFKADQDGRWLGALSTKATKEFETPGDAMKEFEKTTSQKVTDSGCGCCGPPHEFSWKEKGGFGYASGDDCLDFLYPDKKIPNNLREAVESS